MILSLLCGIGISGACSAWMKELPVGFEQDSNKIPAGLSCSATAGDSRFVGGKIANRKTWPWLVKLTITEPNGDVKLCGGTIISDNRILTAAHCFSGASETKSTRDTVNVSVADWNRYNNRKGEFTVQAEKVNIHPYFYGNMWDGFIRDFAVLEIPSLSESKPASCVDCYDEACLPSEHAEHGRACWTAGWEALKYGEKNPAQLREVGVHIMSPEHCLNNSLIEPSYLPTIEELEFCAGRPDLTNKWFTDRGANLCQGDSVGLLVCNDNGRPIIYGVSSWCSVRAITGYPGIYNKVSSELQWINDQFETSR